MPLISLTAAQRSTFLTHVSYSDPSSRARTHSISEAEGKCRDVGVGNAGRSCGTDGNLHWVNILFYVQVFFFFLESGTLRPEGRGECEDERMWGLMSGVSPGGRMHAWLEAHTYTGESRPSVTHTPHKKKRSRRCVESSASPVSEVAGPDVVHWCREEKWDIQQSGPVVLGQRAWVSCDVLFKYKEERLATTQIFYGYVIKLVKGFH